ncbi:MAG: AraC family transcriptional regulator [Cellvibrionaceae bacterium]|nr:AraC family transcriptional regulator [Cellvibrionaceae bacterium]
MSKKISPHSVNIINTILQCKAKDISSKLLIQAKALELLSENLLCTHYPKRQTVQHKIHTTKIHQAADFIKKNYHLSLTIHSISREVGLNEKKLKDGFREILSTTVHNHLEHTRLCNARQRLEEGKKITDIAFEVGYSSPSHFAKRFYKHFGKTPKNWQMTTACEVA